MNFIKEYFIKKTGYRSLEPGEKRTFHLHIGYSITDNIVFGILLLNEFVFLRSLSGSSYQMSFLFQFSVVVFLFLILISEWLKRVRDKQKLVRLTGYLTRLPLAILLFFPGSMEAFKGDSIYHYIFLAIFFVYYMGNLVIFPTINLFLKSNYKHNNFGPLYSYATLAGKIVMLLTTFAYGFVLDKDPMAFRWVFVIAAVAGTVSTILLSMVDYKEEEIVRTVNGIWQSVKESALGMRRIMKENKPFSHFETGFLFYGFAFMSTSTVIIIFFEKELGLSYFSVASYKNAYNIIGLFLIPFFGRALSNIDPRKFAAITFGSILLFLLSLVLTYYMQDYTYIFGIKLYYGLIPWIIFQGIFAATMALLWNIGSAYFCEPHEAGEYQAVHLFLTASRSVFAPILGVLFYELYGYVFTFGIASVSLVISIMIMIWSYRKEAVFKK